MQLRNQLSQKAEEYSVLTKELDRKCAHSYTHTHIHIYTHTHICFTYMQLRNQLSQKAEECGVFTQELDNERRTSHLAQQEIEALKQKIDYEIQEKDKAVEALKAIRDVPKVRACIHTYIHTYIHT